MVGQRFGSYTLVRSLSAGGMGEVYLARHDLLARDAVVKLLLPELTSHAEYVRRFLAEAQAAAQIRHAGIVQIFDVGRDTRGQPYIAMERLHGSSLADRLASGHLGIPSTIALARQLASALGAAHDAGVIHRDLKPDNLFLVADASVRDPILEGGERLKILDFGIAKLSTNDPNNPNATRLGAVFGTPAYMAPEQGVSAAIVDARADLYAVGCILYECLCGRPPFGYGGTELLAAHLRDAPSPPRRRRPAISAELEAIVLALLAKDPRDRPASCAALIDRLDALDPLGAVAARASAPTRAVVVAPETMAPHLPTPPLVGESVATPAARSIWRRPAGAALAAVGVALLGVALLVGRDREDATVPDDARPIAARVPDAGVPIDAVVATAPADAAIAIDAGVAIDARPARSAKAPAAAAKPRPATPPTNEPACATARFSRVYGAKSPSEASVRDALARLERCRRDGEIDGARYADLQVALLRKL